MKPPTTSPIAPREPDVPPGFWQRVRDQDWYIQLMSPRMLLRVLLGVGAADLLVLNFWAVPSALEQTDMLAVRSLPLTAAEAAPPQAPPAAPAPVPEAVPAPAPLPLAAASPAAKPEAAPAPKLSALPARPKPSVVRERCALLLFSKGNWWIGPRGHRILDEALPRLLADTRMIEVIGYADSRGASDLNQRISEERAQAVKEALIRAGVPERRIRTIGAGERYADGSGLDRRTEVSLSDGGQAP